MSETPSPLAQLVALIEADPRSGQALILYALAKTLDVPRGGHMFMLKKLADLNGENRQLAYQLMDLMADGENRGTSWDEAIARLDRAFRADPAS